MMQSVYPDGFRAYFDAWEARIGAFLDYDAQVLETAAGRAATLESVHGGSKPALPPGELS
jgi:hypothetical protein